MPGDSMVKKVSNVLSGLTFALVDLYRKKTLDLFKIAAVKMYTRGVKIVRKHLLLVCAIVFCTILCAQALVVFPVALILLSPWTSSTKIVAVCILGLLYLMLSVIFAFNLFSEKRWMQISGSEELMDDIINDKKSTGS
jgi:hypothetical protein